MEEREVAELKSMPDKEGTSGATHARGDREFVVHS